MNCKFCGEIIPDGRLRALPNVDTCINCSTVGKKCGFRVISGKTTYSELDIVDQKTFTRLTHLQNRRGQSPGNGVMFGKSRTLKDSKEFTRTDIKHNETKNNLRSS